MTREELAAIKARCEAVPIGPWELDEGEEYRWGVTTRNILAHGGSEVIHADDYYMDAKREVFDFVCSARTDIPALLAEVERLNALLKVAEEALEWISDPRKRDHKEPDHYTQLGCLMHKANEALAAIREGAG